MDKVAQRPINIDGEIPPRPITIPTNRRNVYLRKSAITAHTESGTSSTLVYSWSWVLLGPNGIDQFRSTYRLQLNCHRPRRVRPHFRLRLYRVRTRAHRPTTSRACLVIFRQLLGSVGVDTPDYVWGGGPGFLPGNQAMARRHASDVKSPGADSFSANPARGARKSKQRDPPSMSKVLRPQSRNP